MDFKVVDTTLRDGEQMPGVAFNIEQKLKIAKYIDSIGIYQIEAGIPAMRGDEKKSVIKIAELGLTSKISAWNRLNIEDIKESIECGVDIIHVSVPTSQIQIKGKLRKDERWVLNNLEKCIYYVKERGGNISIGFEDASRAEEPFLYKLFNMCSSMGVKQVRYADTVGILTPLKAYNTIKKIVKYNEIDIEFHAHNDFGMAEANTLAAIAAGAKYVDCTLEGIGERAGNCDYNKLILNMDLVN
jgi:homocitrate synthase NifV